MSDYAGTVGAVLNIAGMATGQLWLSAIGIGLQAWGASQQVLPGPKIGDVQKQVAQEGAAIPIVFGYSPPIMGTVVADMREPLIVKKRERQGKGGPKVESESAFRTYAIMFCEGESTLRQAWKNGQIVYNVDDPGMAADNAKFLEYATWLSGSYDQMPHPALEELYGVGNAPAFRGRSVLVLDKEDVTDMRGARGQWHVRVFRGAAKSYTTPPYPILVMDEIGVSSRASVGIVLSLPMDEVGLSSKALNGVHRELISKYGYGPEEIEISSHALAGTHRPLIAKYENYEPEEIEVTSHALSGVHKLVLLNYDNYEPEEVEVTSYALNGTHGPA